MEGSVTASDWCKGIGLSVLASMIGAVAKLAIRKSWVLEAAARSVDLNSNHVELQQPIILNCQDIGHDEQIASEEVLSSDRDMITSEEPEESQGQDEPSLFLPYFLRSIGMVGMSILNPVCCVLAMNYASPSILAPFSGLTLVWVIMLSYPVVGERPSNSQILAALFIVTGEVIVAAFGDHTNDVGTTVEDVRRSYSNFWFLSYFGVVALYIMVVSYWMAYSRSKILRRFAWGTAGGTITGQQNFLKDSLTIFKAGQASGEHFTWLLPFFIFMAALTAFVGLMVLTACMKRYDATYSAATFIGSFVVSASLMSAVHYNTFAGLVHISDDILYPIGLLILMVGVYILVRDTREATPEAVDDDDQDEDDLFEDEQDDDEIQDRFSYADVDDTG